MRGGVRRHPRFHMALVHRADPVFQGAAWSTGSPQIPPPIPRHITAPLGWRESLDGTRSPRCTPIPPIAKPHALSPTPPSPRRTGSLFRWVAARAMNVTLMQIGLCLINLVRMSAKRRVCVNDVESCVSARVYPWTGRRAKPLDFPLDDRRMLRYVTKNYTFVTTLCRNCG